MSKSMNKVVCLCIHLSHNTSPQNMIQHAVLYSVPIPLNDKPLEAKTETVLP